MSIISKALEKSGVPTGSAPDGPAESVAPPGPMGMVSPRQRLESLSPSSQAPTPYAGGAPIMIRAASPFQWVVFGVGLAMLAVGAGFFVIGGRPAREAAPSMSDASSMEGPAGRPALATEPPAVVAPALPAASPTPEVTPPPAPTPMVVKIQVELQQSGGGSVAAVPDEGAGYAPPTRPAPSSGGSGYELPPPPPPVRARPSAPAKSPAVEVSDKFTISGVSWNEKNPMAIINGEVVRPGDKLGELSVIEIKRDSVVVEYKGQRRELR